MRALVVYCHPEPLSSFNAALRDATTRTFSAKGFEVEISDLYAEKFDPVESPVHYPSRANASAFAALAEQRHASSKGHLPAEVKREVARLERADVVIFQFPLWWHAQPAMLKGWFDRVFVNGALYNSKMRYDTGYFRNKRAICSVTTGAPEAAFGPGGRGGDIELLLWPIHFSLHYMGFSVMRPFLSYGVQAQGFQYKSASAANAMLDGYLADWTNRIEGLTSELPLPFPRWDQWDENGASRGEQTGYEMALRFKGLPPQILDLV